LGPMIIKGKDRDMSMCKVGEGGGWLVLLARPEARWVHL
jgi:hypothetical protein